MNNPRILPWTGVQRSTRHPPRYAGVTKRLWRMMGATIASSLTIPAGALRLATASSFWRGRITIWRAPNADLPAAALL
jgi:hypothetical protein